jgi:uncharacterized protein YbjT (DUF2867 family)
MQDRVEVVAGSHGDAHVIARALDGAASVFWLPPGPPTAEDPEAAYVGFSRAFCDALPASSVTHVVGVSALGRGWGKPAGHVTASLAMDDTIGATGVAFRALACASLMDNVARQAGAIRDMGAFFQPSSGALRLPHVAKREVAAVASRLLLDRAWDGGAEVPLHGPADLTFDEMAATISEVTGREVCFQEMPMQDFAGMIRAMGTSDGMAQGYVDMLTAKNAGMDMLQWPVDRSDTPTTFRAWCEAELRPVLEGGS